MLLGTDESNMKLLYITPFLPKTSGQSRYAVAFQQCLERYVGIQVDVLQVQQEDNDITQVRDSYIRIYDDVRSNIKKWRSYDVIHLEIAANNYREYYYAHFLARYAKDISLCLTIHDSPFLFSAPFIFFIPRFAPRFVRAFRKLLDLSIGVAWDRNIIANVSRVFVLTQMAKDRFCERFKDIVCSKVVKIPHISYEPEEEISVSKAHDYEKEITEIVFFGYVSPGKGVEGLMRAYALVLKESDYKKENTILKICGDIPWFFVILNG